MIFITGAASTGKTTLIDQLKQQLPVDKFDVHDIDEADRWGDDYEGWRDAKIEYWLKQSIQNKIAGIETILCGIIYPEYVTKSPSYTEAGPVTYINLSATPEVITERYLKRQKRWLDRQIEISQELRDELQGTKNAHIIDTSNIASDEVLTSVLKLISPAETNMANCTHKH